MALAGKRWSGFLEMTEDEAFAQGREETNREKTKTGPRWARVCSPRRTRAKSPKARRSDSLFQAHDSLFYDIYTYTDLHRTAFLGEVGMRIRTVVGFESSACDLARQNCYSLLHLFSCFCHVLLLRE